MRKHFAVLAIATCAAIYVPGQPNESPNGKLETAKQSQPATVPANGQNKQPDSETNQAEPNSDSPRRYAALERSNWWSVPDWWLVIIAGLTGGFICWQGWWTRKAAQASEDSNRQNAEFFRAEKRPWVGMSSSLSLLDKKSTKPGHYGFTVKYTIKNFGIAPAFNTIVVLGAPVEDVNNYALVRSKVDDARKTAENIVNTTGDLLLPGAEKPDTYHFGEFQRRDKFVVPGCIVYRFADGTLHHTELSYWIDLNEGEKAIFRTCWFQGAD